jgi:GrxC family glutaredoxin
MADIEVYSKKWCPYCHRAKALLESKGVAYKEIDVTYNSSREQEMIERSGRWTVPQIFIDGEGIGGSDDLATLNLTGELDRRLTS